MVELYLDEIARKTNGKILQGSPSASFDTFNIDSRTTQPGEMFFALVSQRNGHDFIPDAVKKGASGAVISQDIKHLHPGIALIKVPDTLQALQKLASETLSSFKGKVIGITGSTGKTTTKEFAASLLASRYNVLKSEGNYNNHIGLPLSILRLEERHEVAVLEMGMSAPGEIVQLTAIAPPDIAVITNIKPVHLEFFRNLKDIASAKREILEGIKPQGTAVLNGNDSLIRKIAKGFGGKKIYFGQSEDCLVRAGDIRPHGIQGISFQFSYGKGKKQARIPLLTIGALNNFLAASAVAFALSVPLAEVVNRAKTLKPLPMRGTVCHLPGNILLIDDSYNSNPAALESVLKDLSNFPSARKVAVLGDMRELGEQEKAFHIRAGEQAFNWKWDFLITIGSLARHMAQGAQRAGMKKEHIVSFHDSEEAAEKIENLLQPGDLVLIKGSRGVKTEKIVERLKQKGS